MIGLSWAIRSKPGWRDKIKNPVIVEKWRKEVSVMQNEVVLEKKLTPNMVSLCCVSAFMRREMLKHSSVHDLGNVA